VSAPNIKTWQIFSLMTAAKMIEEEAQKIGRKSVTDFVYDQFYEAVQTVIEGVGLLADADSGDVEQEIERRWDALTPEEQAKIGNR